MERPERRLPRPKVSRRLSARRTKSKATGEKKADGKSGEVDR